MTQEDFNNLKDILKSAPDDISKAIVERDGVMKEIGELPVTQAIKVYTRRRKHLSEKGNSEGARQLDTLLKNLSGMANTNVRLLSVYFDFGGYTVFISSSNKILGVYSLDTNTTQAIEFLERSKATGASYPKLFRIFSGRIGEVIE